jgi:hypothetical protein
LPEGSPVHTSHQLVAPAVDLADFSDQLSQAWGVGTGASAAQYIQWSEQAGVFAALAGGRAATVQDLCDATTLSLDGVDSLIPILMALGLVVGGADRYALTTLGNEYFLPASPYYVGSGLFWGCQEPIPEAYLREKDGAIRLPFQPPPASQWLRIQLSRNLAAGVCAVKSGRFTGVKHLVDIGGGAGALAIPFALDNPAARVTLVDLPSKAADIQDIIASYGLEPQIKLCSMDVFVEPWSFPDCDGVIFGNFFHVFDDDHCRFLAKKCASCLPSKGRVWLHEVLFKEDKSGPLIAALWNANMHVIGGRQRTASELARLLEEEGFSQLNITPTAGRFSLIDAVRR